MVTQIKSGNYTRIDPINKKVPLNGNDKKPAPDKNEQRFRSFFGRTFPEKKFKEKKEQIIDAVLHSETRLGLNNRLMKIMPGEDVKEVLKRLKPFIKDWPGQ